MHNLKVKGESINGKLIKSMNFLLFAIKKEILKKKVIIRHYIWRFNIMATKGKKKLSKGKKVVFEKIGMNFFILNI